MNCIRIGAVLFLCCCYVVFELLGEKATSNVKPQDDTVTEQTQLEFDAVQKLHIHLDDDNDGDVDFSESEEFLKHELKVKDHKRHSKFHSGDGSISVNDLWKAWQKSEVSKWSPHDVANWLTHDVNLPQHVEVFTKNKINGHHLPRLASPVDGILLNDLKITNIIERKKIALRAMDVVLFGAPRRHNYLKDFVLGLMVLVAMMGFWFSNVQKRKAQKQMESMTKDIEFLQDAEKNLTSLQNRLKEAETNHQVVQQEKFQLESNLKDEIEAAKREAQRLREAREDHSEEIHTRLKLAEQELVQVREALQKAEKEVEYLSSEMSSSLQKWLRITYQKEVKNFQYRRNVAMKKMEEAKDACYRLKRKRGSMFGALRLAHDQNIDDVDQRILAARTSLAEVTSDLEELQYRWQQIETSCRLELGVCTSFLCNESTDSPVNASRLGQSVKSAAGLGSAGTTSRESLSYHRVYTYPSLLTAEENPSPYQTLGKSYERHSSDPSGRTSERPTTEELECNGDDVNGRYTESVDGVDDCSGSEFERNIDSEYSLSQQDITDVLTEGNN
ncbi:stromal interaction molecule 1-like [Dendronephthya gigantea]|uniref:stromal interaction molecule 1-like n=1 Tax=Dendronephthya gigantea TaxID=151771 RepID=UPI00106B1E02|nr:stromal interaction molecule 1-like [Dendronephthya gigantea]